MKKKIFSVILVMTLMANTCMVAMAEDAQGATTNGLNSKGVICYQEGQEEVVIDSADFYKLAERLDQFKARAVEQLGKMQTYLSKDSAGAPLTGNNGVYAGHLKPSPENVVDPLTLDFSEIVQGIAASQTIPSDPAAYGLPADTKLYKREDGKLVFEETGEAGQIDIKPATSANLSAGTAAWVKGELVLGTGEDMAAMYDEKSSTGGEELTKYNITSGHTLSEDVKSAYAYVVTSAYSTNGNDGNHAGSDPVFTVTGGGHYTKLFSQKYYRNGFNVRVALYHVMNAPAGAVIKGSNGLLFY